MVRRVFTAVLGAAFASLLAASAPLASHEGPALAVPTAADFGSSATFGSPVLSPDGRRMAGLSAVNGEHVITVADLTKAEPVLSTIKVPAEMDIGWLRWASGERLLISYHARSSLFGLLLPVTRLLVVDIATGKQLRIGAPLQGISGDDVVYVDPAGAYLLLAVQPFPIGPPEVDRFDLTTGASVPVVPALPNVWTWYSDHAGVVRAGMAISGNRWWLVYRAAGTGAFVKTGRHSWDADKDKQDDVESLLPVAGSNLGYAIATSPNGRFALYRYDFQTAALGELVYEHPAVDIDGLELDSTGALLGVRYVDERTETHWLDPVLKQMQARIDKALPGAENRLLSVSDDKNRALIWSGSATDPGLYLLYDRKAGQLRRLVANYDALVDKQLAPMEPVRYQARDGLEIRGYLTMPRGRGDKGLPLVVMPHGGPFARDNWGYDPWAQYLASKGYVVLQPNYRGSTGFGHAFVEKGYGQWGRGMQDDVDDGVKWLAARGTVDAKRVCIMGASYGGYAAEWAAVRNPELYRCAISFAGVSDIDAQLKYSRYYFSATRYARDWRTRIQGAKGFELDAISPFKQAARFAIPVLIAHGANDSNVPVVQSRTLDAALTKLHKPHEYVEYKGEGHGFADPKNTTDFLTRVGAFLDKYNPS
jgi:dienelactone hydrolase